MIGRVALHRPVHDGATLEGRQIERGHLPAEFVEVLRLAHADPLDHCSVPDRVQVSRVAQEVDDSPVAPPVAVVGDVERLVQVAHEVDQESQRLRAVLRSRGRIGQHLPVVLDGRDDAEPAATVPLGQVDGIRQRNVDVVESVRIVPVLADVVRPHRRLGEVLAAQNVANSVPRVRRQAQLGQPGDDPVAEVPPTRGGGEGPACESGRHQHAQCERSERVVRAAEHGE